MQYYTLDTSHWYITRVIFVIASVLVLSSVALTLWSGVLWWLLIAGLVGAMQGIFAFTGFCPAALVLDYLSVPRE